MAMAAGPEKYFQIGEVSRKAKTSIYTIRFYEKLGLLESPLRSSGRFRLYGEDAVRRLQFIQKAKSFGLSLEEIQEIASCGEKGLGPCCELAVRLFNRKIKEFESKINALNKTKRKLRALLTDWTNNGKRKGRKT